MSDSIIINIYPNTLPLCQFGIKANIWANIDLVERYQTSKDLGTEIKDYPKREYDMSELVENVKYIDFIGINEIVYSYVSLTSILKELQVDQKLVLFYPSNNKFLSQYLGKIRGRIFSTLEEMMRSSKQFAEQANIINFYYLMQFWELQGFFCFEICRACYLKVF